MAVIIQRFFNSDGMRPFLTLGNEEFVRKLSVGSNWQSIRIGVLLAIQPDGANSLGSVMFTMGLCAGTDAPYGASNTRSWIGMAFTDTAANPTTYTYNAGSNGNSYFTYGQNSNIYKMNGVRTFVNWFSGGSIAVAGAGQNGPRRTLLGVVINKGNPYGWGGTSLSANNATDYTLSNLLEYGETATAGGGAVTYNNNAQGSFAETYGALDSVDIYWNKGVVGKMEIYGIVVARVA